MSLTKKEKKKYTPTVKNKKKLLDSLQNYSEFSTNVLKTDFIEINIPKWHLGSYKIDPVTLLGHIIGIVLWFIIWFYILKINTQKYISLKIFFCISIIFWITQIHFNRDEKLNHINEEIDTLNIQKESTMVIFSAAVLFVVFKYNYIKDDNKKILGLATLLLSISCINFNFPDNPKMIRNLRIFHNITYNLGILLIMLLILNMFFVKNGTKIL